MFSFILAPLARGPRNVLQEISLLKYTLYWVSSMSSQSSRRAFRLIWMSNNLSYWSPSYLHPCCMIPYDKLFWEFYFYILKIFELVYAYSPYLKINPIFRAAGPKFFLVRSFLAFEKHVSFWTQNMHLSGRLDRFMSSRGHSLGQTDKNVPLGSEGILNPREQRPPNCNFWT